MCRQQVVVFCFLTIGVSRSKSILRISVESFFFFGGSFLGFELGEIPLRNRIGAWGVPTTPFVGGSKAPPVLSMTYVNSGPSPQPDITFFVTEKNKNSIKSYNKIKFAFI